MNGLLAFQWSDWWLPPVYSEHGPAMDTLFVWIFWITTMALVLVQGCMVAFLIKYRHKEDRHKAHFIHGNTRLEMAWTLLPAVILAALALASKSVWNNYRYDQGEDKDKVQIMVVGEQFAWNVIYPGPDGKVGRYLRYPRPTDPKYRNLSYREAIKKINDVIADNSETGNPLGKDFTDEEGKDDDFDPSPGRPVVVPLARTVEVLLSSKDVLHDFFLPNFRVKLDAVPGLMGHIYFKPLKASTASAKLTDVKGSDRLWIDRDTPGAVLSDDANMPAGTYIIKDPKNPDLYFARLDSLNTLARQRLAKTNPGAQASDTEVANAIPAIKADLAAAGISLLTTVSPFEIVCEELCGAGHGTMRSELIVVTQKEYHNFIYHNAAPVAAATTQPSAKAVAASN